MKLDTRSLVLGLLIAFVLAGLVYFLNDFSKQEVVNSEDYDSLQQEAVEQTTSENESSEGEVKYICQGYKATYLREDIDLQGSFEVKDVIAEADVPTDRATIVVNENAGYIGILTAASVGIGETKPYQYGNFSTPSEDYLMGWEQEGTRLEAILLDKKRETAVWSKTGNFGPILGTTAQSIYFICAKQ